MAVLPAVLIASILLLTNGAPGSARLLPSPSHPLEASITHVARASSVPLGLPVGPLVGVPHVDAPIVSAVPSEAPRPAALTNSTPVAEIGSVIATVPVGTDPKGIAFDAADGFLYVANFAASTVSVINRSTVVATVPVGGDPLGVAYDAPDGDVYVTNSVDNSVSVINGTKVVATIAKLPSTPEGVAVDPGSGLVYVSDTGANEVTVLTGTEFVLNITVLGGPTGLAYCPFNGDIYVADSAPALQAGDNVTLINGTKLVKSIPVPGTPSLLGFDPVTNDMYVTQENNASLEILDGGFYYSTVDVGAGPEGVAYDPANGKMYVADSGASELSILTDYALTATKGIANTPFGIAYDPLDGAMYVTSSGSDEAIVFSTLFAEGVTVASERNLPITATDVNQTVEVTAEFWALGSSGISPNYAVRPAPGFGCPNPPVLSVSNLVGLLTLTCTPPKVGIYTIWLNATDSVGSASWSYVYITVDPALIVPQPASTAIELMGGPTVDANHTVHFSTTPSSGSGLYIAFLWMGVSTPDCTSVTVAAISCQFPDPGSVTVSVVVTDSNEAQEVSPTLTVAIAPDPVAVTPYANRSSVDVGQSVKFTEVALGGGGGIEIYQWSGFPSGACTGTGTSTPACVFSSSGTFPISVTVTDHVDVSSSGPILSFPVDPSPLVQAPTANRTGADQGELVHFFTNASSGSGGYSFSWSDLPGECLNLATNSPSCWAGVPGTYQIVPTVTDSNGGSATPDQGLSFVVAADPVAKAPQLSSTSITVGDSVTISESVTGGTGALTYLWSGLPSGCAADRPIVTCTFSQSGSPTITVKVTDSTGFSTTSPAAVLTVSGASGPFGLSPLILAGIGVGALVVAAAVLLWRSRGRTGRPNGAPEVGPGASAETVEDPEPLGPAPDGEEAPTEPDLDDGAESPSDDPVDPAASE